MPDVNDAPRASKVVAVHLNYRSRAAERGRIPAEPSYFLKPPSSLPADGDPVVRPAGLRAALLRGRDRDRDRDGASAASLSTRPRAAIGWVAAANDFGVYDLRWADRGSNLMAKGQDGFTPIGPRRRPPRGLDLGDLTLRTRVNGEIVQEGSTSDADLPLRAGSSPTSRAS